MKNIKYFIQLLTLFMTLVLFTFCTGQDTPDIPSETNVAVIGSNDTIHQVGKNIYTIFEDSQKNLWFGLSNQGVAKLNKADSNNITLEYFSTKNGLCGNTVANIAEDNKGRMWFGTHGDMSILNPLESSNEKFIAFPKDDEGIPVLGYGWKSVKTDAKGEIWINTHHGIFQYKNASFNLFKVPINNIDTPSFCNTPGLISMDFIDKNGNMWFGTDGFGVYRYDGTSFTQYTKKEGLLSNNVMSITEDKAGNIWFACIEPSFDSRKSGVPGVSKLNIQKNTFTSFKDKKGLYNNNVHTIYADNSGNVWIGATGTGLYKFDGENFTLFDEPAGIDLTSNFHVSGLQSILEDSKGQLWLGYSGGLFKLEGSEIVNVTQDGPW